jgi:hypothetical protein
LLAAADEDARFKGKTMTKKTKEVRELPCTPELELKILEVEFARTKKALDAKREKLAPESVKERRGFIEAFELGDDQDEERALRASACLLEWAADDGMGVVNAQLASGIAKALYRSADRLARMQQRLTKPEEKAGDVD